MKLVVERILYAWIANAATNEFGATVKVHLVTWEAFGWGLITSWLSQSFWQPTKATYTATG